MNIDELLMLYTRLAESDKLVAFSVSHCDHLLIINSGVVRRFVAIFEFILNLIASQERGPVLHFLLQKALLVGVLLQLALCK